MTLWNNRKVRDMITITRKFDLGYAKPVERGVHFSLDQDNQRSVWLDQLVYEGLGPDYDIAKGAYLHNVTITIEIEKATRPE